MRIGQVQRTILNLIKDKGQCTFQDIIKAGYAQQSASRAISTLEGNGLVKRGHKMIDYGIEGLNPYKVCVFTATELSQ